MASKESHAGGDIGAQMRALTVGAAICRREDRLIVRMVGDDRVAFLHGMCSADIKNLKAGTIAYALMLTDHAHVVADLYVWADDGALYLETDRTLWPEARAHLEKFLVADDVEMEELDEMAVLDIVGPRAAAAVTSAMPAADGLEPWHFVKDHQGLAANLPRIGLAAFTVVVGKARVDALMQQLVSAENEIREAGIDALEVLRVEQGIPRVGVDVGDKTLALEARLESGISFDKGCYVGQETVERATARGGVKKRLYGLRIQAPRSAHPGAAVFLDGKEVGHVTSVVTSLRLGIVGLGILHHSAWQPGTAVTLKDGAEEIPAVVSDLPFE
jgi:folate-binding protein YgfZ